MQHVDQIKGYDSTDMEMARKASLDLEKKISMGILYQNKESLSFYDRLKSREGVSTSPIEEVVHQDISPFLEGLR
jgi:hypothetical protein